MPKLIVTNIYEIPPLEYFKKSEDWTGIETYEDLKEDFFETLYDPERLRDILHPLDRNIEIRVDK